MKERRYSWITVALEHCWEFRDHGEAFTFLTDGSVKPVRDLGERYRVLLGKQSYSRYSTGEGFRIACIVYEKHYIQLPRPMTRDEVVEWMKQYGSTDDIEALAITLISRKREINRESRRYREQEKQRLYGHLLGKEVFDGYRIVNVYQHGGTCVVKIADGSIITLRLRMIQCRNLSLDYIRKILVG